MYGTGQAYCRPQQALARSRPAAYARGIEHGGSSISQGLPDTDRPLLAVVLTCLIAVATAWIGYSVGSTGGDGNTEASAEPTWTSAPALLPLREIYASGRRDGYRVGLDRARVAVDRAYVRGRRDGSEEGRRAARDVARAEYRRGFRAAQARQRVLGARAESPPRDPHRRRRR